MARVVREGEGAIGVDGHGFSHQACSVDSDSLWKTLVRHTTTTDHVSFDAVIYFYGLWYSVAQYLHGDLSTGGRHTLKMFLNEHGTKVECCAKIVSEYFPGRPLRGCEKILGTIFNDDSAYMEATNYDSDEEGPDVSEQLPATVTLPDEWEEQLEGLCALAQLWSPNVSVNSHKNFRKVVQKLTGSILSSCKNNSGSGPKPLLSFLDLYKRSQQVKAALVDSSVELGPSQRGLKRQRQE